MVTARYFNRSAEPAQVMFRMTVQHRVTVVVRLILNVMLV